MKKFGLLLVFLAMLIPAAAFAGHIEHHGCKPCHVPHHAAGVDDPTNDVPLWSGASSGNTYTLYADAQETMDSTVEQPQGSSKLCLSCHDGTNGYIGMLVDLDGIDQSEDGILADDLKLTNMTTDLRHTHPISIVYDDAYAATPTEFKDPGTITGGYVRKGSDGKYRVQCASCHDVHDNEGSGEAALRGPHTWEDSSTGGDLCLECHTK